MDGYGYGYLCKHQLYEQRSAVQISDPRLIPYVDIVWRVEHSDCCFYKLALNPFPGFTPLTAEAEGNKTAVQETIKSLKKMRTSGTEISTSLKVMSPRRCCGLSFITV